MLHTAEAFLGLIFSGKY